MQGVAGSMMIIMTCFSCLGGELYFFIYVLPFSICCCWGDVFFFFWGGGGGGGGGSCLYSVRGSAAVWGVDITRCGKHVLRQVMKCETNVNGTEIGQEASWHTIIIVGFWLSVFLVVVVVVVVMFFCFLFFSFLFC